MKICFIAGTLGNGGAEKQLLLMLEAVRLAGNEARVICLTEGEEYERRITEAGFKVEWVGKNPGRLARLRTIIRNLRDERPDIIQSAHFYTNIYAGAAGRRLGIPSIGAVRSDFTREVAVHGFLGSFQARLPRFLVTNSRRALERAVEYGVPEDRVAHIRNVVRLPELTELTDAAEGGDRPFRFLFVGRLVPLKRVDRFVRLAEDVIRDLPGQEVVFTVAGDGECRESAKKLAAGLKAAVGRLEFLGHCPDMASVYERSDVVVSTSEQEGTPNAILEAMSYGLPVICTRTGGSPELVGEDRGIVVEQEDREGLADAAKALFEDDALRRKLGDAGRAFVAKEHSMDRLSASLQEIYEGLIKAD